MAFKYIYGTCRNRHYDSSLTLEERSLNGRYTTEFFNRGQFSDFTEAGITELTMPIPDDRFTGVLPKIDENEQVIGTVPKLTRFVMLKYSDIYTTAEDLAQSVSSSSSDTAVDIFDTIEETVQWLQDNTDLTYKGNNTFEITGFYTDDEGVDHQPELLTIK